MKTPARLTDRVYISGLAFLSISLCIFCIPFFVHVSNGAFSLFVINFIITALYFFTLLVNGRLKREEDNLYPVLLFCILFLVSAFSLNRELGVFENSVPWLSCLLVILCINYIAFAFKEHLAVWLHHVMHFLLGIGLICFVYLSFYLTSLYAISAFAFFILGISLHTFVPLLFCIYSVVLLRKTIKQKRSYLISFCGGIASLTVFIIYFVVQWGTVTSQINSIYRNAAAAGNDGLPAWVAVAGKMRRGWIAEKVLKAGLIYSVPDISRNGFFRSIPQRNFDEERKHDPLVMMAALFAGNPACPQDERIRILESMYDSRHQAQQRLWSGESLVTEHVYNSVQVWPRFLTSYTEQLITVTNTAALASRSNREEAIYTFHLPEGGVVTALSLWIEGEESKGILTTAKKADAAYTTIVGVEQRDPSVVHWQEGNTVTVRVFPVNAGESRMFKLGITAPLNKQDGILTYENIYFDGPGAASATEDVQVSLEHGPDDLVTPAIFNLNKERSFRRSGKYEADWSIQFKDEGISRNVFSFGGKVYSVKPYHVERRAVSLSDVYLDVNASWTKTEFDKAYMLLRGKNVFVYRHELLQLRDDNKDALFERLHSLRFSLFPVFAIKDASRSLLVSKSNTVSPNLQDIEGSPFLSNLKAYLAQNNKVRLFNIGSELSPYLKTLKEYRAFEYEYGNLDLLKELVDKNHFAKDVENDHEVVINNARMVIEAHDGTATASAPDHLMRLFAYNHILQKTGTGWPGDSTYSMLLIEEARTAHIVSPVSSLIVLETQKDYDRFGIQDSKGGLKNAGLTSKGAVPEPHEWALVIITLLAIAYVQLKPVLKNNLNNI